MFEDGFLGIHADGWKQIAVELASAVVAPVDLARGVYELATGEDKKEALTKIAFGVVGFIPVIGAGARLMRAAYKFEKVAKAAQFVTRTASEMSKLEKFNQVTGGIQRGLNVWGKVNTLQQGVATFRGVSNWGQLTEEQRVHTLVSGARLAAGAVPWAHNRRAKKETARLMAKSDQVDQLATYREQLGVLPPRNRAPRFAYQPAITHQGDVLHVTYPSNKIPFKLRSGIPGKDKLKGLAINVETNFTGGLKAYGSGNTLLKHRVRTQYNDRNIAQIAGIKGIEVRGLHHLPQGDIVAVGLNHYSIADFAVTNRAMYSMPRKGGVGFDESITMKANIGLVPGLDRFVGLSSKRGGHVLIPLGKGATRQSQGNVVAYFERPRPAPQIDSQGTAFLPDRSVWFYGTGGRTTRSLDDFKNTKDRILHPPYHGAFNASVAANKPVVPVSFHYTHDGIAKMQIHRPRHPETFSGGQNLNDEKVAKEVAEAMRQDVIGEMKEMTNQGGFFNQLMGEKFVKPHTGTLGGV